MKNEDILYPRCPYCSNHCLLKNPKCSKGKELATALAVDKMIKVNNEYSSFDVLALGMDEKLLTLLCKCVTDVCPKNSYQMLLLLLRNGSMQEEALFKKLYMKASVFKKLVHKLIKKELIHKFPINKSEKYQIVLSKYGIKKAKKIDLKYTNQTSKYFETLDESQKHQLEILLEKLVQIKTDGAK